jgi:hypothetical protein
MQFRAFDDVYFCSDKCQDGIGKGLTCIAAIGILYALGINDAKARFDGASLSGTRRTNLIFLMPVLAGYLCLLASPLHSEK